MRKLAREAVIFALLGMLLAVIGAFVTLDSGARSTARSEAAKAVHAACVSCVIKTIAGVEPWNRLWLKVPLSDGTVLDVLVCEPAADIDDVIKDKDFLSAPQNKQIEYVSDI